ncbi:MAG: sulfate adenylyltransferase, partial [Gammaproteobacteria bacterium]|nr:sulfate adenylyltransferase [Gammaproteobacteria bacterium]
MKEIVLTPRQRCDIECLLNGAFFPLDGFNDEITYDSIVSKRRLPNGAVWPMPIVLDVDANRVIDLSVGENVALYDQEGIHLANMTIHSIWQPNKMTEAMAVYQTSDDTHPGVHYLLHATGEYYIGGPLEAVTLPSHYDFTSLRLTPHQLKQQYRDNGIQRVVAFQTRNPMHRAHQELTLRAAKEHDAHLLIHPVVGMTKPGDVDHYTRVRCYQRLMETYPKNSATLSLLPIAMRMAGPVEALWHAIIRKNYGCTHFIVGRDHAGPGKDKNGHDFYGPYDAQALVKQYEDDIGIQMVPFHELVYVQERDAYLQEDHVHEGETVLKISGTEFRRLLKTGEPVPHWFSYPGVIEELRKTFPT